MIRPHLLIIRFSAMGDVAMTVPVVYSLAKQYPDLRITVLSKPFARVFFEDLAPNVGFMAADPKKELHGIHGLNVLYRRLVAKNPTAIADFHNILRSNYLRLRFNLGQFRVAHLDKHRNQRHHLVSLKNKDKQPLEPVFQGYCDVLAKLGYPVTLDFKSIFPEGGAPLRNLPAQIGEKKAFQQWIGIAPFAAHPGKMLPKETMKKAIRQLAKRHPSCRIFLFGGGAKEKQELDHWVQELPNCQNASAILGGLDQELALMSHLDVMVSMDSANMHLASLVSTPVVSVWGATHPYAGFMGWQQSSENAVQVDLDCRPCSIFGNKPCQRGDFACMRRITPEMIVQKVEKVITDKQR